MLLNVFSPAVDPGHLVANTQAERITYVHAEQRRYLEAKAVCFGRLEVTPRVVVQGHGEVVDARELRAELVVVVSQHVSDAARALLGSHARGVLRLSACPVPVVRPAADTGGDDVG